MASGIDFSSELEFRFSKSGGKGGQHVNKVATKAELRFDVSGSELLTPAQKKRVLGALKNRLSKEGVLLLTADTERSQLANKRLVVKRFQALMRKALLPLKKRIPTKTPAVAKGKRLENKKKQAEKKQRRQKPDPGEAG